MRWAFIHFHYNKTIIVYAEFEGSHQDHQVQIHKYASISTGTSRFVSHNYYGSGDRKCLISKRLHNPTFGNKWKVHSKLFDFPNYIQFKQRQNLKYLCLQFFIPDLFVYEFLYLKKLIKAIRKLNFLRKLY